MITEKSIFLIINRLFRIGHKLIEKKNEKRKLINDISISATKFQKFQSITQVKLN